MVLVTAPLPPGPAGPIVCVIHRRWQRNELAATIDEYLIDAPRRLLGNDTPAPTSRGAVAGSADHEPFQ